MLKQQKARPRDPIGHEPSSELQTVKLRLISRLAGGAAHDLNNLLTVIGGFTEVARGLASDRPGLLDHLDCVKQASLQASAITARLLAYAGGFLGPSRPWKVADLAEGMRKPLGRLLGEKIPLSLELTDGGKEVSLSEAGLHGMVFGVVTQLLSLLERADRVELHLRPRAMDERVLQLRLTVSGKRSGASAEDASIELCRELARESGFSMAFESAEQSGVAFDLRFDGSVR